MALTLSDAFCVDRFRGEFIDLMRTGVVDTVFANTDEALSLYQTTHLHEALDAFAAEGVCAVVTRSEKGSVIVEGDARTEVPAHPIARLVDTTGRRRSVRRRLSRRARARRERRRIARGWRRWRRARSSSTSARGRRSSLRALAAKAGLAV